MRSCAQRALALPRRRPTFPSQRLAATSSSSATISGINSSSGPGLASSRPRSPFRRRRPYRRHWSSRSEERRVGKEGVSTCRTRWSQKHEKKNTTKLERKTAERTETKDYQNIQTSKQYKY